MPDPYLDLMPAWLITACLTLLGACVGSFLNVVIYRSPLGLSLSEPKRSFCPACKTPIRWYHNIPVVSWLALRGKCASCGCRISFRYCLVELLTAALFCAIAISYDNLPLVSIVMMCLWGAMAVAIAFIDGETMLVFPKHTLLGAGFALIAAIFYPMLVNGEPDEWSDGLYYSLLGAAVGFITIRIFIELGKLLFGSWRRTYDSREHWRIKDAETENDEISLVLPDKTCTWSELFSRPTDKAIFTDASLIIDGAEVLTSTVTIYADRIETEFGKTFMIEDIKSAEGTLVGIRADREAMGSGDAWIMLMIGALCAWEGCVFTLLCASLIGIIIALIGRLGFGKPMPFGPSLLIAATLWLFAGKQLWIMYIDWIMG